MTKTIPDQVLIELARLAPKVEPEPENVDRRSAKKYKVKTDPRVAHFIEAVEIKAGRNPVSIDVLFEAFNSFDNTGIEFELFRKSMTTLFKITTQGKIKLNMKPITILEKAKEVKHHEQKEQIQTS